MVINPNTAGTSNGHCTTPSNIAKAARPSPAPADDVTLSSRTAEEIPPSRIPELTDSESAWQANNFARNFILSDYPSSLLVQANVNPQSVIELLAE